MALIIEATKFTNAFPANASRNLYSAYPAFNNAVQRHSDQILSTISKVLKLQHIKGNIQRYGKVLLVLSKTKCIHLIQL